MVLYQENMKISNMNEEASFLNMGKERHSLYVRFPNKLNADRTLAETEVKSLNSKIIRVRTPRQRSANFCLVDFESKDDKEKAFKELKKCKINEKLLVVKEAVPSDKNKLNKKCEKIEVNREVNEALSKLVYEIKRTLAKDYTTRNVTNGLIVKGLTSGTTQADIKQAFPQAIDIKITLKPERKNSFALIWLPTPKDAKEASKQTIKISDEEYVVSLQNDGKSQNKQKRSKVSTDEGDSSSENVSEVDESEIDENVDSEDVDESD